jgi:hypothetical protein
VLPVELAFGVRSGSRLPGVRSDVLPWLPGSVLTSPPAADGVVLEEDVEG